MAFPLAWIDPIYIREEVLDLLLDDLGVGTVMTSPQGRLFSYGIRVRVHRRENAKLVAYVFRIRQSPSVHDAAIVANDGNACGYTRIYRDDHNSFGGGTPREGRTYLEGVRHDSPRRLDVSYRIP